MIHNESPADAYYQVWGEKVGLGRCPHCPKLWCWQSPNGWVCQLPKVFTYPPASAKTQPKEVPTFMQDALDFASAEPRDACINVLISPSPTP